MKAIYKKLLSINDWDSFFKYSNTLSKQEKGELFEKLTELILRSKSTYKSRYKNVWLLREGIHIHLRKKLNLPNTDEGIDIIAETHTGLYCAIQCKFKGANQSPTRKDIATFLDLSRNHCKNISEQILVHTGSNGIRKTALLPDSFTQIGLDFWASLTAEDWIAVQSLLQNKKVTLSKRSPRRHQTEAIEAAGKYFIKEGNSRGKLIMPCGTGKSLTAYWIAEALESKATIIAVPSLYLIKQSLEDWTKEILLSNSRTLPEWICICSDESTGKLTDDFVTDTYSIGIPTTTNEDEIARFLRSKSVGSKIVFTTYQSANKLAKVSKKLKFKFNLAILDEAHKTVGSKGKAFSTLLNDQEIIIEKRLFMTATERIVRGSSEEVLSMDDFNTYGRVIYQLSFKKAIEQNIITDYRIITILVNDHEIKQVIRENKIISDRRKDIEEAEAQMITSAIALNKAIEEYGINHTVSFHKSISAAKEFQSLYQKLEKGNSKTEVYHISSKQNAGSRAELLNDFKGAETAVITNARCLTEGVDVPGIDCVLFADEKHSVVDIVQASGRALRRYTNIRSGKSKELGYIIIPLILKDQESFDDLVISDRFKTVIRIVASLSTQDETIAEIFRILERGEKLSSPHKLSFLGTSKNTIALDLESYSQKISTEVWNRVAKYNFRSYNEAKAFVHSLKLNNQKAWFEYCLTGNKPNDIPSNGYNVYLNNGWKSWGDWLGTGRVSDNEKVYRDFSKARDFVKKLNIKNREEWKRYCKSGNKPIDIPTNAYQTYRNKGWLGWGDWLGTGRVQDQLKVFKPFKEAREFVHTLKFLKQKDWIIYCKSGKRPADIPRNPDDIYKGEGWINWNDWLGAGPIGSRFISNNCLDYEGAKLLVHSLRLYTQKEWRTYCRSGKKPNNIPANPPAVYKNNGWRSWRDWLGTTLEPKKSSFLPFNKAREYVLNKRIRSKTEWFEFCKSGLKPLNIPVNPAATYKNKGWVNWQHWLK